MSLVYKSDKNPSWIRYINYRIYLNRNFLGFISGQTGSGKSWSTISICEQLDPEFNIERVVFSGLELMELINSGKLKKGSAVAFEEVGVNLNTREWASKLNKLLNYMMQTIRHRNFIFILNAPYMDFVDSATRKLFHAELSTVHIDKAKKVCRLKPQLIQYNSRYKKFYYKYLRVVTNRGVIPCVSWDIKQPSKELIKAYEKKKREFTQRLNEDILDELKKSKRKKDKKKYRCLACTYVFIPKGEKPGGRCPRCNHRLYIKSEGGVQYTEYMGSVETIETPPV